MGGNERNFVQEAFDTNWVAPGTQCKRTEKDLEKLFRQ
jgi:dTDP-4-amino-4,6-dideoxygalactose transaminase